MVKVQGFYCESIVVQYVCKYCDFVTDFWISLHNHTLRYHLPGDYRKTDSKIDVYTCNYCEFISYSLLVRLAHEKAHVELGYEKITSCNTHSEDPGVDCFKCEECEYKARNKTILRYHIKTKHRPQDVIQCRHCSYRTAFQHVLKRHIINHHTDPEEISWFECKKCEYMTKQKTTLKRHIGAKHADPEELERFICEQCEFKTNQKYLLKGHINAKHHRENLLQCSQCSYRAAFKSKLKRHILSRHSDPEKISWFECGQCEYKAKDKRHLKRHIGAKHRPEEAEWFICEQCEYKTNRKDVLKRHINTKHPTENLLEKLLFRITEENTLFPSTDSEEISWFECDQCKYKSRENSNLKKHIERMHHTESVALHTDSEEVK